MDRIDFKTGTFYLGDCFEVMATLGVEVVDLILTDPPFGMDYQSNRRVIAAQHAKIAADDGDLSWLPGFMTLCDLVAKPNTAQYFFCSHHKVGDFQKAIGSTFRIKNLLVWEKDNHGTGDLKGDFAPKCELCWFSHKGRALLRGGRTPNVLKFPRTKNELHPTQKPVGLILHMMEKFSDPGQLVFDPFAGSGTTAIAAIQSGRRWTCIECDPGYFEKAIARVWEAEAAIA